MLVTNITSDLHTGQWPEWSLAKSEIILTAACAKVGREKTTKNCFLTRKLDLLNAQGSIWGSISICICSVFWVHVYIIYPYLYFRWTNEATVNKEKEEKIAAWCILICISVLIWALRKYMMVVGQKRNICCSLKWVWGKTFVGVKFRGLKIWL